MLDRVRTCACTCACNCLRGGIRALEWQYAGSSQPQNPPLGACMISPCTSGTRFEAALLQAWRCSCAGMAMLSCGRGATFKAWNSRPWCKPAGPGSIQPALVQHSRLWCKPDGPRLMQSKNQPVRASPSQYKSCATTLNSSTCAGVPRGAGKPARACGARAQWTSRRQWFGIPSPSIALGRGRGDGGVVGAHPGRALARGRSVMVVDSLPGVIASGPPDSQSTAPVLVPRIAPAAARGHGNTAWLPRQHGIVWQQRNPAV